jgi:quaternary ammonium compound-resistance protein SugE
LSQTTKTIPIAIAFPVWTGVSLIGVVVIGAYAFSETIGVWQLAFIGLIAVGAVGLKML